MTRYKRTANEEIVRQVLGSPNYNDNFKLYRRYKYNLNVEIVRNVYGIQKHTTCNFFWNIHNWWAEGRLGDEEEAALMIIFPHKQLPSNSKRKSILNRHSIFTKNYMKSWGNYIKEGEVRIKRWEAGLFIPHATFILNKDCDEWVWKKEIVGPQKEEIINFSKMLYSELGIQHKDKLYFKKEELTTSFLAKLRK